MERKSRLELERRIHALLCGDLGAGEKREVLWLVARDEEARDLLGEMLALEQSVRAACSYDAAQGALNASSAWALRASARTSAKPSPPPSLVSFTRAALNTTGR